MQEGQVEDDSSILETFQTSYLMSFEIDDDSQEQSSSSSTSLSGSLLVFSTEERILIATSFQNNYNALNNGTASSTTTTAAGEETNSFFCDPFRKQISFIEVYSSSEYAFAGIPDPIIAQDDRYHQDIPLTEVRSTERMRIHSQVEATQFR